MVTRRIEVVRYDPRWPAMFAAEASLLRLNLPGVIVHIQHMGSTAIPGIKAKPVIDLLVEVEDIDAIDVWNQAMEEIGYRPRGELGIPGRRYFSKNTDMVRTHHAHFFPVGHPEIERHLLFRDYLREHPQAAMEYSQLKEELAARFRYDSHGYTEAKNDFVQRIDRLAREWGKSMLQNCIPGADMGTYSSGDP